MMLKNDGKGKVVIVRLSENECLCLSYVVEEQISHTKKWTPTQHVANNAKKKILAAVMKAGKSFIGGAFTPGEGKPARVL